jgi:hypothetical protein
VAKWHKRTTVEDLKTGPAEPLSTVLTEAEEEAMIVAAPLSTAAKDLMLAIFRRCTETV